MSGPALNPLASIAPVSPSKGPEASAADASAPQAGETGFASELKRQMKGEGQDSADKDAPRDAQSLPVTDSAMVNAQGVEPQAPLMQPAPSIATLMTPEMASLIAGLQPLASKALPDEQTSTAPPEEGEALVPLFAPAGLPTTPPASKPSVPPISMVTPGLAPPIAGTPTLEPRQLPSDEAPPDTSADQAAGLAALYPAAGLLNTQPAANPKLASAPSDGNAAAMPAAGDTTAANTAVTGHNGGPAQPAATDPSPRSPVTATVAELASRNSDVPSAPAQPTNSFAAMHAAALATLQPSAPQSPPSPIPLHVATPASSPHWPEEVGNKVNWMVSNTESHAELTLTPPQLGKVEVSITINGDQTSAQFVAATPAARDLIEQNLPRLREVLEQSGINLGQTDVGTSGQSAQSGDTPAGRQRGGWQAPAGGDEGIITSPAPAHWARRGEGLVDTFA